MAALPWSADMEIEKHHQLGEEDRDDSVRLLYPPSKRFCSTSPCSYELTIPGTNMLQPDSEIKIHFDGMRNASNPLTSRQLEDIIEAKAFEIRATFRELPMCLLPNVEDFLRDENIRSLDLNYSEELRSDENQNAQNVGRSHTVTSGILTDWANAPEFIPNVNNVWQPVLGAASTASASSYVPRCHTQFQNACDICGLNSKVSEKYKRKLRRSCQQDFGLSAEETAAAVERSRDKTCGICFDVVMEKPIGERRFGILTMCNHCFCLECIRKWRQARNFENRIVKSCPNCRITSDFVCPSIYWVEAKEEKDTLIEKYKSALSLKDCKYFKQGTGICPFGNKCFYLHAFPNGRKTDVGPPPRRRRAQYRHHEDLDFNEMLQHVFQLEWHEDFEDIPDSISDIFEDLMTLWTDSEEDWSDYELF